MNGGGPENARSKPSKANPSRVTTTLNPPGETAARQVAQQLAQKLGAEIIVSDCDGIELWTIRRKLDS
jgi:hypothetical protein